MPEATSPARVATTSSEARAAKLAELGADAIINYRDEPDWTRRAREFADAVDLIVEVGGAETLDASLRLIRPGGTIALIGVLSGAKASINLPLALMRQVRLQGVTCGHRENFTARHRGQRRRPRDFPPLPPLAGEGSLPLHGRKRPCREDRDRSRIGRRLNLARLVQHGRLGNPVGAGFCAPIAVPPSLSLAGCVCRKSRRARGRWARRWKRHDHDPAIFLERHRSPIDRAQIPSRRRFADMETNEAFGRFVVHDCDIPGPPDRGSR
jgi:Zinc-binding dehydrogenase